MQDNEAINPDENEHKEYAVGDPANHASVVIFTGANYCGAQATWSSTWPYYKIANGDDDTFDGHFGSLIVLRGECETTTSIGGSFPAPDDTKNYYDANQGKNNQGCFPELGSNTNRVTALRTQRDDIIRPTNTPYLVLRDHPNKITDAKAIVLQGDTSSIDAFACGRAIAVGSTTGEWFLFEEENYQGRVTKITVDGGDEHNVGNGFYSFDEDFIVRSVRMTPADADTGYWVSYPEFGVTTYALKNVNYPISKITVRFVSDSARELAFAPGALVEFAFNSKDHSLYYDGKRVDYIDMNNGGSDQDFAIPTSSSSQFIFYARKSGDNYNVLDFENSLFLSDLTFSEGISGNQSVTFKQSLNSGAATINLQVTTS